MQDTAAIRQLLADAEAAYHQLMTGTAVVEVRDQSGDTIRYQAANAFRLHSYIQELRRKLGNSSAQPRPMKVWF